MVARLYLNELNDADSPEKETSLSSPRAEVLKRVIKGSREKIFIKMELSDDFVDSAMADAARVRRSFTTRVSDWAGKSFTWNSHTGDVDE